MPPDPSPALSRPRRSFLRRGLINQLVCLSASVPFWLLSHRQSAYWVTLLYSMAIGNLIWLFIDGGRQLAIRALGDGTASRARWQRRIATGLIVVIGSLAGYSLGASLIDALLGFQSPSLFEAVTPGVITLLVAGAMTHFFWSRERLHAEMAAAEAARRLALENQLKLLESQLEPHMLFNTLANLRVLIGLDPPRAQAMLDRLIAFLRGTLNGSRKGAHPLRDEFDRLADYLALMTERMGPRLAVRFDLPPDLRELPVPPLLLQPLVENAVRHGLEPKVEGGRIEVSARRDAGRLRLTVRDTGVGLPRAAAQAPGAEGTRYGTAHVRERLAALFGDQASFDLTAAPGPQGGTLATLLLPWPTASRTADTADTADTAGIAAPAASVGAPCPPR